MSFRETGMSGMDGIMFNGGAPMMEGTWQNPQTGHKFTVRDTIFEDGQLKVTTTDGRILDYNMIQNYVQCKDSEGHNVSIPTTTPRPGQQKKEELPPEIAALIEGDDPSAGVMIPEDEEGLGNMFTPKATPFTAVEPTPMIDTGARHVEAPQVDLDTMLITKVLGKKTDPSINGEVTWENCPIKQLVTLVDTLSVEPEAIANYYINKLDKDAIFEAFKQGIATFIQGIIEQDTDNDPRDIVSPKVDTVPLSDDTPVKKAKKTTKKK